MTLLVVIFTAKIQNNIFVQAVKINFWKTLRAKIVQQVNLNVSLSTGDGQNNRNTRQFRNKTVCIGCTERTLAVSISHYSFVSLRFRVPVSVHYGLC